MSIASREVENFIKRKTLKGKHKGISGRWDFKDGRRKFQRRCGKILESSPKSIKEAIKEIW